MFRVALPCYLGLNSGQPVSINVNKTRKHFSRYIHGARMFPQCFQLLFSRCKYAYATRQGILTKIRACEHLQKFGEHEQTSEHSCNFCKQFKKGQILRALSNWMRPLDTPPCGPWRVRAPAPWAKRWPVRPPNAFASPIVTLKEEEAPKESRRQVGFRH